MVGNLFVFNENIDYKTTFLSVGEPFKWIMQSTLAKKTRIMFQSKLCEDSLALSDLQKVFVVSNYA